MKFENIKILGTIHKLHNENKNYSIAHIKEEIRKFCPDIIAIEIRNQDMKETNDQLMKYYPPEMIEIKMEFEKEFSIVGFDWRGEEIEDISLKNSYSYKNLRNKNIENLIEKKQEIMNTYYINANIHECQNEIKLQELCVIEENINKFLIKYGYKELVDYKKNREIIMGNNLFEIISQNKKTLILTGITHVLFLNSYIKNKMPLNYF